MSRRVSYDDGSAQMWGVFSSLFPLGRLVNGAASDKAPPWHMLTFCNIYGNKKSGLCRLETGVNFTASDEPALDMN